MDLQYIYRIVNKTIIHRIQTATKNELLAYMEETINCRRRRNRAMYPKKEGILETWKMEGINLIS